MPNSTELGPANVLVNAVCPGWVDTGLWRRNAAGLAAELGAGSEDEARRLAARKNALGRFGRPEELADAIAFQRRRRPPEEPVVGRRATPSRTSA